MDKLSEAFNFLPELIHLMSDTEHAILFLSGLISWFIIDLLIHNIKFLFKAVILLSVACLLGVMTISDTENMLNFFTR